MMHAKPDYKALRNWYNLPENEWMKPFWYAHLERERSKALRERLLLAGVLLLIAAAGFALTGYVVVDVVSWKAVAR